MSKITAILVDDEISNLKGLQLKLTQQFPEITIIATFQKPEDAITEIPKLQPDILFLDIEMPRINGFELLSKLTEINFEIIFVTAYSEYALEAFKKSAVDYVLKPIDNLDLKVAVKKALGNIDESNTSKKNNALLNLLIDRKIAANKLIIPTNKGVSFIQFDKILHIEGYDGYTKIHLENKTEIVSSYNIGKYEKMMNENFYKCHKSHIINLQKVSAFENEGYILLDNEKRVPVSKTKRKEFIDLFSK